MLLELEAVYENGVLRPLEPMKLAEHQRVRLTVREPKPKVTVLPEEQVNHRYEEMAWIQEHREQFRGQYVALEGKQLISHGTNLKEVLASARSLGFPQPLIHHVPAEEFPEVFWV